MKKRILCLVLAAMMLSAFAACNQTPAETAGPSATAAPSVNPTAEPSSEPVELQMYFTSSSTQLSDKDEVLAKINEIALAETNTTINLNPINGSAYKEQLNLMFAGKEQLDIIITGTLASFDYANQCAKGLLTPIGDLVEQYGPDIKEVLGDYLSAGVYGDGNMYALTTRRDLAQDHGMAIRSDLVEKYGIDLSVVKEATDIGKVFTQLKEKIPAMTPVFPTSYTLARNLPVYSAGDPLGDDTGLVLMDPLNSLTISNLFTTNDYLETCKLAREWFKAGYTLMDIATTTTTAYEYMKAGTVASILLSGKPGIEAQLQKNTGYEVTWVETQAARANTNTTAMFMWAVPTAAKDPVSSVKFLNLMYGNADVINLLTWGIKDKHYVVEADGRLAYPAGVDAKTVTYAFNTNWIWGDQFKQLLWNTNPLTLWDDMEKFNNSANKSKALGFLFDTTSVKTEVAAITNTVSEYMKAIENGLVEPEKAISEFNDKLKSNGIEKVLAEKQKQLDAWAAKK